MASKAKENKNWKSFLPSKSIGLLWSVKEAGYRGKYSFLRLILSDMKDLHGGLIHKLVFDAQSFQGTFSMGKQNNGHFSLFCGFGFVLDYFAFCTVSK